MIEPQTALVRVFLAPVLITLATIVGRKVGPRAGGLVAGLPLTSGPVSAMLMVEHGQHFAAEAAVGTVRGLAAAVGFITGFGLWADGRWIRGLVLAIAASLIMALGLEVLLPGLWLAAAIVALLTCASLAVLPDPPRAKAAASPPRWDLPARAIIAAATVWLLVSSASALGPSLTGLLSPAPVFAAIMLSFAAAHDSSEALVARGMLYGTLGFLAFFISCALLLGSLGWPAYVLASIAALIVAGASLNLRRLVARPTAELGEGQSNWRGNR